MRIAEISVAGYRSLRAIRFPVGALTVFVGQNGVGKTNLYRATTNKCNSHSLPRSVLKPP
jgi:predicted ATPase